MKKQCIVGVLFCIFLLAHSCMQSEVKNIKDLDENMMDIRIYQENLGDHIKEGQLEDAVWLLEGMDSILVLLGQKFKEHRKLENGFSYYYKNDLNKPIQTIRKAIRKNDTAMAHKAYKLMIRKCNGCHIDHDIDKTVRE
jgi:hypothetical protein